MSIYLYGMILSSNSFLLYNEYPKADTYAEIKTRRHLLGGETGTAAAILTSLGCNVVLGGTHLGTENADIIRNYFKDKTADISGLKYKADYAGVMDFVIIDKNTRTCFGEFGGFFSRKDEWYGKPDADAIAKCSVVGTDPFFGEEIAKICHELNKPFATIDSSHDTILNKYCAINAISHEHLSNCYPNENQEQLMEKFTAESDGLIIFTNGEDGILYGRKGQPTKRVKPYNVDVISTLGAGDSFKAGTIYALEHGMNDDDTVRFAAATAAYAISHFPIPLNPPTIEGVNEIINIQK